MAVFDDFIYWLDYYSAQDVLIPFLLVFMVVYAVLEKSKVLGDDSKNFNVTLGIIMGLAVVMPHVLGLYGEPSVVDIINRALPQVSLLIVGVVMFFVLVGIFGKNIEFGGSTLATWAVWFALIAVAVIFGSAANWFTLPYFLGFLGDPQVQSFIVIVLVFGLIIAFITKDEDKDKERGIGKAFGKLGDFLGK